ARSRWRLLAVGPRRRRHERLRPSRVDDGGRIRARRSQVGGGSRGHRQVARHQGPGDRRVVTVKGGVDGTPALMDELKSHVARKIGALARPDDIISSAELPKTRSGKIMRRLLRDIAEGRALGDTTTLADPAVVASLKTKYEDQEA